MSNADGTLPRRLFHYTRLDSLLKIADSASFWATDIQYLNDSREYHDAVDIFKEVVRDVKIAIKKNDAYGGETKFTTLRDTIIRSLESTLDSAKDWIGWDTFTISFSVLKDDLSQWRAYARPAGLSIGFDYSDLEKMAKIQNFFICPCIYDYNKKYAQLASLLDSALKTIKSLIDSDPTYNHTPTMYDMLMRNFHKAAASFKDVAFSSEKEWRIVSESGVGRMPEDFTFHSSGSTLIPHLKFRLSIQQNDEEVAALPAEIIVGPCPFPDLNVNTIKALFRLRGLNNLDIKKSPIPFRDV
jgi:hypothetical protein